MEMVLGLIVGLLAGIGAGYLLRKAAAERAVGTASVQAKAIVDGARREAEQAKREALVEAKDEIYRLRSEGEAAAPISSSRKSASTGARRPWTNEPIPSIARSARSRPRSRKRPPLRPRWKRCASACARSSSEWPA